ncbi:hypothetical protein [Photobacterium damselae]|uniref:hypothetical protein n=1 Tax=Photobacterium damselae TaxID=38293 RepID=UPI0025439070|nr:hypothetical protein [Photobacterium damselae]
MFEIESDHLPQMIPFPLAWDVLPVALQEWTLEVHFVAETEYFGQSELRFVRSVVAV